MDVAYKCLISDDKFRKELAGTRRHVESLSKAYNLISKHWHEFRVFLKGISRQKITQKEKDFRDGHILQLLISNPYILISES